MVRWPGVEPGSAAWKATMLTVTPPTLAAFRFYYSIIISSTFCASLEFDKEESIFSKVH